jgi:hypothetical protein
MEEEAIEAELEQLRGAALALYFAGKWSCHRPVDEVKLWEDLRDALGLEAGAATKAGTHA